MKSLFNMLLVFLFLLLPNTVSDAVARPDDYKTRYTGLADDLRSHSVRIEIMTEPANWTSFGSGTLVEVNGQPNVLTAWHVAEAAMVKPLRVCPVHQPKSDCVLVLLPWMTDRTNAALSGDWALFQLLSVPKGMKPAEFRERPMAVGESIYVFASPIDNDGIMTRGIVSGFETHQGIPLIKTDAFVFFGSSGGGLYDEHGRLVGVVVAITNARGLPLPQINFSVPIVRILNYLKG